MRHATIVKFLAAGTCLLAASPACNRVSNRDMMLRSLVAWHGKAAGAVVAIPPKNPTRLVMLCGPAANLGPDFKPTRTIAADLSKGWRESELVAEMDLLLAEDHRTHECQRSINARAKSGWAIKTIRSVLWACPKRDASEGCRALDMVLDDDVAEPRPEA